MKSKSIYTEEIIPRILNRLANFGDTIELNDQLKEEKRLISDFEKRIELLQKDNNELETERNILKSILDKIMLSVDKKEVIDEIYEENNLDIDFKKLIRSEIKNYVEEIVGIKSDDEEYD